MKQKQITSFNLQYEIIEELALLLENISQYEQPSINLIKTIMHQSAASFLSDINTPPNNNAKQPLLLT